MPKQGNDSRGSIKIYLVQAGFKYYFHSKYLYFEWNIVTGRNTGFWQKMQWIAAELYLYPAGHCKI